MSTTSTTTNSPSVLIVGAGPTGLVLALTLLQNGIKPRIINKELAHRIGQRGSGIQARTLEVHRFLGTLSHVQSLGGPGYPNRAYKLPGGTVPFRTWSLAEYVPPTPDIPYPNGVMLGQERHEALLRSHLAKYDCFVELATELKSFEQHPDHVVAHIIHHRGEIQVEEDAKFTYLIGAEGAHSVVRKTLGLSFLGETTQGQNLVVGDIHIKKGLSNDFWHAWGNPASKGLSLRPWENPDDDRFCIIAAGADLDHTRMTSSREELVKIFYEITGRTDVEFGDLDWISNYQPNIRMVNKFGEGRVFVAGDAAHVHSPTGGQGMNSGIQDAFNLGWKLSLVLKGLSPPSLLASYSEERLPVIAAMLDKTSLLLKKLFQDGFKGEGFVRGFELRQLGVNYRGSPIIVDDTTVTGEVEVNDPYRSGGVGGLRGGDRAPDAPGLVAIHGPAISYLFDLFKPSWHTVLVFSTSATLQTAVIDAVKGYPEGTVKVAFIVPRGTPFEPVADSPEPDHVLEDFGGFAYKHYIIPESDLVIQIIRPDGVVGAIVRNADGVGRYFKGVFN